MKAIVNATPLIALALIDRLDLLPDIFDEVIVPEAVYNEVVRGGAGRPGAEKVASMVRRGIGGAGIDGKNISPGFAFHLSFHNRGYSFLT